MIVNTDFKLPSISCRPGSHVTPHIPIDGAGLPEARGARINPQRVREFCSHVGYKVGLYKFQTLVYYVFYLEGIALRVSVMSVYSSVLYDIDDSIKGGYSEGKQPS